LNKSSDNPDVATPEESPEAESKPGPEDKGPNLVLLYSLLGLGLLAAMAFAALIVWPFYLRR
jgi:hypothetical protein